MKKELIVTDNREFNNIIDNQKFFKNQHYVIYIRKKNKEKSRFGIAVGKKVGNAVIRNRLKRQLRNIIVENLILFQNDYDYIIMVKKQCLNDKYSIMNESLKKLLKENLKNEKREN